MRSCSALMVLGAQWGSSFKLDQLLQTLSHSSWIGELADTDAIQQRRQNKEAGIGLVMAQWLGGFSNHNHGFAYVFQSLEP